MTKKLEDLKNEMLESARTGKRPARSRASVDRWDEISVLRSDFTNRLVRAITEHHPASINELAELVDAKQSQVSRHIQKMEKVGIVKLHRSDRRGRPEVVCVDFVINVAEQSVDPVTVGA